MSSQQLYPHSPPSDNPTLSSPDFHPLTACTHLYILNKQRSFPFTLLSQFHLEVMLESFYDNLEFLADNQISIFPHLFQIDQVLLFRDQVLLYRQPECVDDLFEVWAAFAAWTVDHLLLKFNYLCVHRLGVNFCDLVEAVLQLSNSPLLSGELVMNSG